MDFFRSQEVARRKTGMLIAYFFAAVASMIAILYFVAVGVFTFGRSRGANVENAEIDWWRPEVLLAVAAGTISIITLGSLYKMYEMRAGGENIAQMLGGRRLQPATRDRDERRLLNIVEEMALASGTPVPPVYLLDDEESINAFAAGFTPGDAVIGINRGTLDVLSRDELQGVIAHEFSHILNGDMRLNLRLIGVLHGILMLAIIGFYLMRGGSVSRYSSGNRRDRGGGQIVMLGLAMLVIGYVGLFFARLIKAAVSRQREYLADAAAVQFTRNPDGIATALKKIGGHSSGARMKSPEAETASHMFFGNCRNVLLQSFSTHPPLVQRIQRIDSTFDGKFPRVEPPRKRSGKKTAAKKKDDRKSPLDAITGPLGAAGLGNRFPIDPVLVMAAVGAPTTQHVKYAHELLARLPDALKQAVHDTFSARAVVLAMLLDADAQIRQRQLEIVAAKLDQATCGETAKLAPLVAAQGEAARFPLIEMAQTTLQGLSPKQYEGFRETVDELVKADRKIELFEFALQRVLIRRLDRHFKGEKPPAVLYSAIGGVINETSDLISALAHLGHQDEAQSRHAFEQASQAFAFDRKLVMRSREECSLRLVSDALAKLTQSSPAIKKRVLTAATVVVTTDGKVTVGEGELLRAIADSLDCPMPPIFGG